MKQLVSGSCMTEKEVKEGMSRLGFKYKKDLCKLGKDSFGKFYKGGYEGIKYVPDDDCDDED